MRVLLLGSESEAGQAFMTQAQSRQLNCVSLASPKVELHRARRLARMLRRYRPDCVVSLLRPQNQIPESAPLERGLRLCEDGLANLSSLCKARGIVLLHLSSDAVFAGAREGTFSENDAPAPIGPAGEYILRTERGVASHCEQHIVLRTGWVFTSDPETPAAQLLEALDSGASQVLVPSTIVEVAPVSPRDIARVLLTMVMQIGCGCEQWGYYHYSAKECVAWGAFVGEFVRLYSVFSGTGLQSTVMVSDQVGLAPPVGAQLGCKRVLSTFGVRQRDWRTELEAYLAAKVSRPEVAEPGAGGVIGVSAARSVG